jgi:diguanylate cyclase (GGDEF)-like protein
MSMANDGLQPKTSVDLIIEPVVKFRDWRSAVLDRLLPIASLAILPALLYAVLQIIYDPQIKPWGVILEVLLYLVLLVISFYRRLGANRRSWGLMLLIYLGAVVTFLRGGLAGDGRIYLVTLVVLSAILINTRISIFSAILSLFTFFGFSFLAQAGVLTPWLIYTENPLDVSDWLLSGLTMVALTGVLVYTSHRSSLFHLQTLQTEQQFARKLIEANQQLEQVNLNLEYIVEKRTTELREANHSLAFLAMHDTLTGLPNRVLLYDRLQQAVLLNRRNGLRFAVLFIDLDDFKTINDTHGHEMGDQLLVTIARILQGSIRESDTVARLGGDEFVMLLNEVLILPDVERVARILLDTFCQPLQVGEASLQISASIGISLYPENGADPEMLLQKADTAMYAVKRAKKNNFQFFQQGNAEKL